MNLVEKQKFLINFAFIITVFTIFFISVKFMTAYLLPFVIGLIIAYAVQKPSVALSKRTKFKKEFCAAVFSVLIYLAVLIVIFLLLWLLYARFDIFLEYFSHLNNSFKKIAAQINGIGEHFSNTFGDGIYDTSVKIFDNTIKGVGTRITEFISGAVSSLIRGIPTFLISAIVTVVATCYISKDYDRLKRFLKGIFNDRTYQNIVVIKNIFTDCILKFLWGYLRLACITFFILLLGLLVLDVKNFLITAFLISMIDLLPVLGTGIILLPWSAFVFLQGEYRLGAGIVIIYLVICVIRNFAEPKIIGKQMGINPLFTLVSMFLGLKLAGVAGMVIFPITLIVIFTFYKKQYTIAQDKSV